MRSKLRARGCWSSDTARRTEPCDDALAAPGRARVADAAPVPDQEMGEPPPLLARHEPDEVALDLDGVLLPREAEPLGEPAHVRVDDDSLRMTELGSDDVRRL